jgi:hypothetical protein
MKGMQGRKTSKEGRDEKKEGRKENGGRPFIGKAVAPCKL